MTIKSILQNISRGYNYASYNQVINRTQSYVNNTTQNITVPEEIYNSYFCMLHASWKNFFCFYKEKYRKRGSLLCIF